MLRHAAFSFPFLASAALDLELDDYRLVDLTHAYREDTIYRPTAPSKFPRTTLAAGETFRARSPYAPE